MARVSASRLGCVVLGLALVASVALHVQSAPVAHGAAAAPSLPPGITGARPAPDSACATELAACRREGVDVALRSLEPAGRPSTAGAGSASAAPAAHDPQPSDFESQKHALCKIGEDHVRAHWNAHKDEIVARIRDIGTDAFARRWTDEKLGRLGVELGVRDDEKRRLRQRYSDLWREHGPRMQARLEARPQDFAGLLDDARVFWHAEDAMITKELGDAAMADYRAMELRSRTAIAAILGTYAGREYEESNAW